MSNFRAIPAILSAAALFLLAGSPQVCEGFPKVGTGGTQESINQRLRDEAGPVTSNSPQPLKYARRHWTVEEGLPVNSIRGLTQGPQGYLWMATNDGLVRFDGVDFSVYRTDQYDGLPSNRLRRLVAGPDSTLWMLTGSARLVRFRINTGTFAADTLPEPLASQKVTQLNRGPDGTLWISTEQGALAWHDRAVQTVLGAGDSLYVWRTIEARDGTVWLATKRGLYRTRRADVSSSGAASASLQRVAPQQIRYAHDVHQGPDGTLWVSSRRGLFALRDGRVDRLSPDHCRPTATCVLNRGSPHALVMRADSAGTLWLRDSDGNYHAYREGRLQTIARGGLSIGAPLLQYGPDGARWRTTGKHLYRNGRRVFSVDTVINALTIDRQGNIWVGTYRNGLYRLRPSPAVTYGVPEGLRSDNAYAVHVSASAPDTVWVGTLRGGLARIDRSTGRVDASPLPTPARPSVVWTVWQEPSGRLWIGGEGLRYVEDGRLRTDGLPGELYDGPPTGPPRGGPAKRVRVFFEDAAGGLWVGSQAGLYRRASSGTWRRFGPEHGGPASLVRVIEQDARGALWMGTKGEGLFRYRHGTFEQLTTTDGLSSNFVRSIHVGRDGALWVGTEGEGLCRIDRRGTPSLSDDRIGCLAEEEGLFDDVIHTIVPDGHGRLWMSANRGIFWVERAQLAAAVEGRIEAVDSRGYTEEDGLRNREANGGGQPAATRTPDGRLWFATQGGVVVFDPDRLDQDLGPPPVAIEHLSVGDSTLRTPGPSGQALRLRPEQRTFAVKYTGLNLQEPSATTFRYRLRGFESWRTVENQRQAYYTDVAPGTYTFEVQAATDEGSWTATPAQVSITVAPHWWETTWFWGLSGFVLLGMGAAAYRWRVHSLEAQREALEATIAERTEEIRRQRDRIEAQAESLRELDAAKSRFFANVSHEFRTPLTLILGPVRDFRAQLPDRWAEPLDLVERNAQQLYDLVERLLGIARMDAGTYRLQARPVALDDAVPRIAERFHPLADRRRLTLNVDTAPPPDDAAPVHADLEALDHIVSNLLSNALKFTPAEGRVTVQVTHTTDAAEIVVADTGRGIPPSKHEAIFERFTQSSDDGADAGGVGIGLAVVKDLVDLHGGRISVDSAPGEGATFTVRLPRGAAHLASEHRAPEPASPADSKAEPLPGTVLPLPETTAARPSSEDAADAPQNDQTTVLVVDDNPDLRTYVRSVLTPTFRVLEASNGREGAVRATDEQPDCILADEMMPEMRGTDMVRQLRANRATDYIPIIMLTARADPEEEVEGLTAGADDYLTKPFDPDVLRARIFGQIERRRQLRRRLRAELKQHEGSTDAASRNRTAPPTLSAPTLDAPPLGEGTGSSQEPEFVHTVRRTVEKHLADPDLTVQELAREVAVSRSTLYRRLKAETGQTPSAFIRQVRIEYGARLLREGTGTVSEVAYAVGFNSLTYFGKRFREHVGVTPSEYADADP